MDAFIDPSKKTDDELFNALLYYAHHRDWNDEDIERYTRVVNEFHLRGYK